MGPVLQAPVLGSGAGVSATDLAIAVTAAVLGAAGFGLASAAQQRATREVTTRTTLSPRLLVDLTQRPMWLLGLTMTALALAMQIVALAFAPLVVVQPLLVTGVVFAGVFAAVLARRRPDRVIVLGGLLSAVGLAAFLLLARPVGGSGSLVPDAGVGLLLAVVLGVLVVACLAYAAVVAHPSRIVALALATGVLYGVTAALMKVLTGQFRESVTTPFTQPVLYVTVVAGCLGFLLSQNTFQQGRLISPAVAVITSVDPLVGVFAGVLWLGERVTTTPAVLWGEALAAIVVLTGIAIVTWRGSVLLRRADTENADAGRAVSEAPDPPSDRESG